MSSEASITKIVGENVRRAREAIGLSQEELGDKAGIDRTYVSGVERGVRNPTVKVLARLADALGVPPAQLLARGEGAAQGGESRRSGSSS
ncbi:helix-turn-helix domain-containing protein [Oryzibacter oryziterrae]|uniref:helix-turn-helix domain-containing protein n=1 Tax=Oryzibacter oryziterrae TaxID=2766474 RepID=UPI001F33C878|nr:helix-turn-helix transcriptional regulator [Oryzibacter oryziterrae]